MAGRRVRHSAPQVQGWRGGGAGARARRFASDVSHELPTPLAAMLAVTEVLDEDADRLAPDTAAAVRLISAETGELAVLVEDLMETSRFDARAAELHTDEVDVVQAIRKTLSSRHWNDEKQVTTDLPDGVTARLDPRRFDVVIANLVGNALRHDSAVRLRVQRTAPTRPCRTGRSLTDDTATPAQLVVEVTGHGPGIAADALPHVFERFYKADVARTRCPRTSSLRLSKKAESSSSRRPSTAGSASGCAAGRHRVDGPPRRPGGVAAPL